MMCHYKLHVEYLIIVLKNTKVQPSSSNDLKDIRKWQQNQAWKTTNGKIWKDIRTTEIDEVSYFQKVLRINNYTR